MTGRAGHNLTKVEIGRQQDSSAPCCLSKNPMIACMVETDLEDMNRVVPRVSQPLGDPRREVRVDEKAHGAASGGDHLVSCEPSRVGERLTDVFPLQIGILRQHIIDQ